MKHALHTLLWLAALLIVLRFCAWADTGMRGDQPFETHLIPDGLLP